jgi:uncharacterized membrane protein
MPTMPVDRSARDGRTFSRSWNGPEYGAAVTRFRRRANWADRLGWIATAALLCATLWVIYW